MEASPGSGADDARFLEESWNNPGGVGPGRKCPDVKAHQAGAAAGG